MTPYTRTEALINCRCCGNTGAKNRAFRPSHAPKWLCDECWADPNNKIADCLHGGKTKRYVDPRVDAWGRGPR